MFRFVILTAWMILQKSIAQAAPCANTAGTLSNAATTCTCDGATCDASTGLYCSVVSPVKCASRPFPTCGLEVQDDPGYSAAIPTKSTTTWTEAEAICTTKSFTGLCSKEEICSNPPGGQATSFLVSGIKDYGGIHVNLPVSDRTNDYCWALLTDVNYGPSRICKTHLEYASGVPGWATSGIAYSAQICCSDKTSGLFVLFVLIFFHQQIFTVRSSLTCIFFSQPVQLQTLVSAGAENRTLGPKSLMASAQAATQFKCTREVATTKVYLMRTK